MNAPYIYFAECLKMLVVIYFRLGMLGETVSMRLLA
jgi:hypothetical protein